MAEGDPVWLVSASPHVHSGSSVRAIMLTVVAALMPAFAWSVWSFGWDAVRLTAACVLTCLFAEAGARRIMGRNLGIDDGSALVTGLLLAFNLPPALPTWMAVLGSLFAILLAKQVFGGLGYNPFNPALMGRIFLLISFPGPMTTWSAWTMPAAIGADAVTNATPLGLLKTTLAGGGALPFNFDAAMAFQFFLGNRNGCIGEVSALALLIGGVYLLARRCIYWQIPVFYLGTVFVFAAVLRLVDADHNLPPLFQLLSGGLILGAFFMATDMVTTPLTGSGMALFGCGCGILTMVIRKWGGYPEGVSFAIVIMNAVTPLLNRAACPRAFGRSRSGKAG